MVPNAPMRPAASCAAGGEPASGLPDTPDPCPALRPGVVVLAAGASRRLGQPKQLLPWQGETLVVRAVRLALAAGAPVRVVLGAHATACAAALAGSDLHDHGVVHHVGWEEGMGSSLAAGVASLPGNVPAVLVLLVDQPRIEAADLLRLVTAWQGARERPAASRYSGGLGVPAIFPARDFERLRALRGDTGARALLAAAMDATVVAMPTAAFDIDEPGDLGGGAWIGPDGRRLARQAAGSTSNPV